MSDETAQYCDLVMKGGITSGIVYPNAVLALTERYRFKNIGGTSAGAIAAAACAAAALGERRKTLEGRTELASGFSGLAAVAETLKRRGFIYSLFQPAPGGRAAFRLIVTLAAKPGPLAATLALLRGIVTIAPLELLLTLLLLLGIAYAAAGLPGLLAAALPALICTLGVGGSPPRCASGGSCAATISGSARASDGPATRMRRRPLANGSMT
jgi:hypothetical protein